MKRFYFLASLVMLSYSCWSQGLFSTKEYIDINNIKAVHLVHGDMWWDPAIGEPQCEYPKGSGKNVGFASSLWIGGYDQMGQLHAAAQTYRQDGNDYWPGPLNNGITDSATITSWAKIWKVNRTDIDLFHSYATHTLANTPTSILTWPGRGNPNAKGNNNTVLQITADMAPFADVDHDGIYNPLNGDYPNIKGDQMLWWIINDNGPAHNLTHTQPLQVEIQNSVYAYNLPGVLNTVVYYEFLITNKSGLRFDSLVVGLNADMDLGYTFDDYIGYDSSHRMGIVYNATSTDGTGDPHSYGNSVPLAGVSLMELPGDAPSQRAPAGSFMYYNNALGPQGNPTGGQQMYGYMNGTYKDNSPLVNDWDGIRYHQSDGYGTGTPVKYVYPGDPADTAQWSECNSANTAGDRRFVIATNPFSLLPNTTKKVGMALIVQPNAGGCPGFSTIKNMADSTWWYYNHPPIFPTSVGQPTISQKGLKLYPNPANNSLFIERPASNNSDETVLVYDAIGRKMNISTTAKNNTIEIGISQLIPGVYTVVYRNATGSQTNIFVKE